LRELFKSRNLIVLNLYRPLISYIPESKVWISTFAKLKRFIIEKEHYLRGGDKEILHPQRGVMENDRDNLSSKSTYIFSKR
jgi:hypothetical protein